MSGRAAPMPAWAQFFLIPAILVTVWILGQTIGHVLFVFIVSVVVALILNPLVRMLRRARVPRGLSVLLVYLSFVAAIGGGIFLVINPVQSQVSEIRENLPSYTDDAQRQVISVQRFFDDHGIDVNVQERIDSAIQAIRDEAGRATDNIATYSLDVLSALITFIIILVCSIYMLLDAPRIARFAQRIAGPGAGQYLRNTERTLVEYVKAQLLVSLIIGVSAGVVLWFYGVTGVFAQGATYAVAFAAWVFLMEFVPYVGPVLGAVPPTLIALFTSPATALWVVIAFVAIHQFEGHIVVPKIMGGAVGVHPLVVIFGLLIGEQLYGLVGILLAIPLLVILKETVVYASDRFGLARWRRDQGMADPEDQGSPPPPGHPASPPAGAMRPIPPPAVRDAIPVPLSAAQTQAMPTEDLEASTAPTER
jgi:predicted PurR-regulated permease PerM